LSYKNVLSTQVYVTIDEALFPENDQFHSATAANVKEATKLIEAGFEYVTTFNETMMFRKRK